jgi:hypothetical protein
MAQSILTAGRAHQTARRAAQSPLGTGLMRLGYAVKGVIYVIVGVLAFRVAIGSGGKTTDNKGALQSIYQQPFGQVLLGIVTAGLFGYALWCFARAILDMDHKGTDGKGLLARTGYAVVGIMYAALALAAVHLLSGSGGTGKSTDVTAQDYTARLLAAPGGPLLVTVVGLVVVGVALYLFYYAYSARFMEYFRQLQGTARTWVRRLGRIGYGAQGVIFTEVGIFLIVAAQQRNAHAAKGIGGSLAQLAREPYGHVLLGIVAVGLIAYGVFSFAQARYRRAPETL